MNKYEVPAIIVVLFLLNSCTVYKSSPGITENDLQHHLQYLASDELQGRYPGTKGDMLSGKYIQQQFTDLKLQGRQQKFFFVESYQLGRDNDLEIEGRRIPASSYTPMAFSKDTMISAPVVFAGYGLEVEADSFAWSDYRGLEVKDRWVMVLRGVPDIPEGNQYLSMGSDDRDKAMLARDKGAAGIIMVSGTRFDPTDKLSDISLRQASAGIPALHVTRPVADNLLAAGNATVEKLENEILHNRLPKSFILDKTLKARTDLEPVMGQTSNWFAIIEGADPVLKQEYVVIGAHVDHLGMGGSGSSSRRPDTTAAHNGADDNASGVSALLEIAENLNNNRSKLGRSFIITAFGAEEKGLLGSKYFVNNPPVNLGQVTAMINLDMVGRLDTVKGLQIGGTGTSLEADSLIRLSNQTTRLKLSLSQEGSGPSDHSSFYGKDIPVFFITTGAHTDYHTPDDDIGRINFAGLKAVSEFAYQLALGISTSDDKLTFREAGPRESPTASVRFKVTLGFMPDFSAEDVEGVRVDFVSKGKAAERGGIKNGDIITAIDGMPVRNIYDYMYRLSKLSKNQIISVELLRNGQKEVLIIQL